MAEIKWIKITTDIFDDEKILLIESLPDADAIIVIWFKLLCLAGKQNNSGVFLLNDKIPFTDKMLATIFRRKESTVQLALQTFEGLGMIEVIDGVITIPNWGKHQNLAAMEKKTNYMREYMRSYRARQKAIAETSTNYEEPTGANGAEDCKPLCKALHKANVSRADIDKEREEELERDNTPHTPHGGNAAFDRFWAAYPKKVGKIAARKAFDKVRVPIESLLTAIERQKCGSQWSRDNGQYIPNPATWLNQGRWDDEVDQGAAQGRPMTANDFVPKDGKYKGRDFFDDD